MTRNANPRQTAPPASGERPQAAGGVYDRLAVPVLEFADDLGTLRRADAAALVREAAARLTAFAEALARAGVPVSSIPPARYALALAIDRAARDNRAIDTLVWNAAALPAMFDGREITLASLRQFIARAEAAGPDFAAVAGFLARTADRLDAVRTRFDRSTGPNWTGITIVLVAAFLLAVAAWTIRAEWSFHARLTRVFKGEAARIAVDDARDLPDLAERLDRLRAAVDQVSHEAAKAPVRLAAPVAGFDAAAVARADYAATVARDLPPVIAASLEETLATEGHPDALYDALRARSVLDGASDWSAAYLAGWLSDQHVPGLAGLAPHALALSAPSTGLPAPDGDILDQARDIAAEASEADRAYLELTRSDGAVALPAWQPDVAVPGLTDVILRRSGLAPDTPIPGLFTAAGWDYARDIGAGLAVQTARAEAARIFKTVPVGQNDAPDRVMARLQTETLARWDALLADLRVRPFQDPDAAIRISGALSQAQSPLVRLIAEVWQQAGGNDRARPYDQQLAIVTDFGPMIQYVEQGRMKDISALFAGLNVALGAVDRSADTGMQRLMSVQDRAQSITALRQAPAIVAQMVEDVLAQTGAAHSDMLSNPVTRAWQTEALTACRAAVEGQFPFVADGGDADPARLSAFFGAAGLLDRFMRTRTADYLDTATSPWRWKPEARFAGLSPESAAFFERAKALSDGLFGPRGLGSDLSLAALAERGTAFISIGGQGGPVTTSAAELRLNWPGAEPAKGVEVSFETPEGTARLSDPGPWGLLRVMEPFRLRERDGGQRFVIDLHTGTARLFLEVTFDRAANVLAARRLFRGLTCPPVL